MICNCTGRCKVPPYTCTGCGCNCGCNSYPEKENPTHWTPFVGLFEPEYIPYYARRYRRVNKYRYNRKVNIVHARNSFKRNPL